MRPDGLLRTGFVVPLDLRSVLTQDPPFVAAARFCLVAEIDSTDDVAGLQSLHRFLTGAGHDYRALGKGIVTDTAALSSLLGDDNYFTGFDEIWLFREEPAAAKPEELSLTTVPLAWTKFKLAAEWMAETNCIVGLGDGDGLAWVTNEAAVAGWISSLEDSP